MKLVTVLFAALCLSARVQAQITCFGCTGGGGSGSGVPCVTTTIASSALTASATSMDVNLGTALAAKSYIITAKIKEQTQFACTGGCTGITAMTVSVGTSGNSTAFSPTWALFTAPSNTNFFIVGGPSSTTDATQQLVAHFTVTNTSPGNLGNGSATNLTAGSVDVSFCYVTLP